MNTKNQPRILMIGTSPHTKGGVSTVVKGYLSSIELNERYLIKYVSTHRDGNCLGKIILVISGYLHFIYLLVIFQPQIIHIHAASRASFYRKSILVIVAWFFRKPVVYHHHGAEFMQFYHEESGPIMKYMIRFVLNKANTIIALSNQWKENFKTIDPRLPVQILPNAIVVPSLPVSRKNRGNIVKILFMGRVGKRKGIHDLIDAIEILATSALKFHLVIGGDGDIDTWKGISSEKSIEPLISFKGWVSGKEKEDLFEQADIYVLPSYNEGLPMSILEAISYGLPIVATPVGGIPEAVFDRINGFLVNPGDAPVLANRLHILITDESLRHKMGIASRKLAEDKFDLMNIIKSLEKIYSNILANHIQKD